MANKTRFVVKKRNGGSLSPPLFFGFPFPTGRGPAEPPGGKGELMRQELPRLVRVAHNPPLLGKKGRPVVQGREELVKSVGVSG